MKNISQRNAPQPNVGGNRTPTTAGRSGLSPCAPPVYRPLAEPRVLQTKDARGQVRPPAAQVRLPPTAPPVYRPQNKTKTNDLKPLLQRRPPESGNSIQAMSNVRREKVVGARETGRVNAPRETPRVPAAVRPAATAHKPARVRPAPPRLNNNSIQRMEAPQNAEPQGAIQSGQQAAAWVKSKLPFGAGNVRSAIIASEGKSYKAFEKGNELRRNRDWRSRGLDTTERIFFRAGAPLTSHGGNCEEHADLTFVWLMRNTKGLVLNYAMGDDHAYIIIGDLKSQPLGECIVVDPWTTIAIVGPYKNGRAQDVKKYELTGALTGGDMTKYNDILKRSKEILSKNKPDVSAYTPDDEATYRNKASRAYNV